MMAGMGALKRHSVLPGFPLALGTTLFYLGLIVLVPIAATFLKVSEMTWTQFFDTIAAPRVLASLRLSFGAALAAALINGLFGLVVAWVLVRYRFPGRRIVDALVDLPFALPTAVAGIALTTIYAPTGWIGAPLEALGIKVAFTPLGILIALTFIGLPFVVRTVQPVLEDMERELEEAAESLGATALQTFVRIILPTVMPALVTGFALAFARAVGEYGSVVFIAGNIPLVSEITPVDHHYQAGAVRLYGGDRCGRGDAGDQLCHPARDQRAPGLGATTPCPGTEYLMDTVMPSAAVALPAVAARSRVRRTGEGIARCPHGYRTALRWHSYRGAAGGRVRRGAA